MYKKQLIYISILVLSGCSLFNNENTETDNTETIPVTQVITADINTTLEYVADVHALQNVEIRARVEGYLEAIYVDEGKEVKKGQLLFKINDEEYQAELNRSRANLKSALAESKSAEVELERVKLLVEKNVIAKTEVDLANAKLEIAKAKIEQAKADEIAASVRLAHTQIRSPFNGIIDRIPFKIGSLISAGTLLTTISDIQAMNVYFKVSEVEYLEYFKNRENDSLLNSKVELVLADGSNFKTPGKIETMESEFESGTGALAIRARFKNDQHLLKHGSTGKIKVKEMLRGAIVIPQKATIEIQDKNYVMVLDNNNMISMKSFEYIDRYEGFYIVSRGLQRGDKIVYEGVQNLREGSVIKPKMTDSLQVYGALFHSKASK